MHTGNICKRYPQILWITVYPCAYREHAHAYTSVARGARFIPVHTGNMLQDRLKPVTRPVYPCAYREHFQPNLMHDLIGGLSLCIQGTFSHRPNFLIQSRFIPVHTGNI